jgi:hypothetical protein
MNFRHLVETGQLRPLRIGGVLPICMDSFRECFGTTRIPGQVCVRCPVALAAHTLAGADWRHASRKSTGS